MVVLLRSRADSLCDGVKVDASREAIAFVAFSLPFFSHQQVISLAAQQKLPWSFLLSSTTRYRRQARGRLRSHCRSTTERISHHLSKFTYHRVYGHGNSSNSSRHPLQPRNQHSLSQHSKIGSVDSTTILNYKMMRHTRSINIHIDCERLMFKRSTGSADTRPAKMISWGS